MQDKTTSLPLELWRVILSHLTIVDLCHCCQVSKAWQELVHSLDNTRWKELYLCKNPWRHPNWPNKPKQDPKSWQKAYKERFLSTKQWLKSGADSKCGMSLWHVIKKRNPKVLHVGYGQTYSRLKDAIVDSSAFDTIYVHEEIREEQSALIVKHPLEIIGVKTHERKVRVGPIEIACPTVRISNVLFRPSSSRPQNPLPTLLKVQNGCLHLDNCVLELGHLQVTAPGRVHVLYCSFNNASIHLRTSFISTIEHCEFLSCEHSAIITEGTQTLSKPFFFGMHLTNWMSRYCHKNLTVEELYSHVVQKNMQKPSKLPDEEKLDSHLLIKDLKEKISLSEDTGIEIPTKMSVPLSQRTSLTLGETPLNMLRGSTGCIVRDCYFHSRRGAVIVRRQGSAWLEKNEISNVTHGIRCIGGSKVVLLANHIHDCNASGVCFRDRSTGLVAGNVIVRNGEAGVEIRNVSDPYLQHNQIFNGRRSGVVILDGGRGTLVDNDIYDSREAGVYILYRGNPVVRYGQKEIFGCNRIWAGRAAGIAVTEDGFGHVSFNDICGMEWGGIDIRNGGHPVILNNVIHKGHGDGVVIGKNGCGLIFENVIKKNCGCGVWILSTSRPVIFGNHISECGDHGVAFVSTADDLRENQRLSAQFLQQEQEQEPVAQLHIYDDEPSSASLFEDHDTTSVEFLSPQLEKNTSIVDNNTICSNQGSGLSFAGTEGVIIRGNILTGNHGNGIAIEKPGDVIIHSNRVNSNGALGVSLDVSTIACLRDNSICGNHGTGIVAHGRGRIKENDIIGNRGSGVVIWGPGDPFITRNRIYTGEYSAVEVLENARGCVTNNEIYSKTERKVVQDAASTTVVEDNKFLASLMGHSAGGNKKPVDLTELSFLTSPPARPRQTGEAIPRGDIAHIVRKLTMSQVDRTSTSCRTMSRFCVLL